MCRGGGGGEKEGGSKAYFGCTYHSLSFPRVETKEVSGGPASRSTDDVFCKNMFDQNFELGYCTTHLRHLYNTQILRFKVELHSWLKGTHEIREIHKY